MPGKKQTPATVLDDDVGDLIEQPGMRLRNRQLKTRIHTEAVPFDRVSMTSSVCDVDSIATSVGDPFAETFQERRSRRNRRIVIESDADEDDEDYEVEIVSLGPDSISPFSDERDSEDDQPPEDLARVILSRLRERGPLEDTISHDLLDTEEEDPTFEPTLERIAEQLLNDGNGGSDRVDINELANLARQNIKASTDHVSKLIAAQICRYVASKGDDVDMSEPTLSKLISYTLKHLDPAHFKIFETLVPRDAEYRPHAATREERKVLKERLVHLRDHLDQGEPTKWKILHTPVNTDVAAKLLEVYDLYSLTMPFTIERMQYKQEIHQILSSHNIEVSQWRTIAEHTARNIERHVEMTASNTELLANRAKMAEYLETHRIQTLEERIFALNTNDENKAMIYRRYLSIKDMIGSPIMNDTVRSDIQWIEQACDAFPTRTITYPVSVDSTPDEIRAFIQKFRDTLDSEIYGMTSVKHALEVEMMASFLSPDTRRTRCIGLIGEAGTGKSWIAKTLGRAMGLPVAYISMGTVSCAESITGGKNMWVGSKWGQIVDALIQYKTDKLIIVLDEIDKVYENQTKGDQIIASLIHLLDPTQNSAWKDEYFDGLTHDLSNVYFVLLMNDLPRDKILSNRLRLVHVKEYTPAEQVVVVREYLWKRACKAVSLDYHKYPLTESAANLLINVVRDHYWDEKGFRKMQYYLDECAKRLFYLLKTHSTPFKTSKSLVNLVVNTDIDVIELTSDMMNTWFVGLYEQEKEPIPLEVRMAFA